MILLPNSCYCGDFTVYPSNWKQIGASIKKDWYISYRFYDPQFKQQYPAGKLRIIKGGINRYKDLPTRRMAVQQMLEVENQLLKCGFNPITKITFNTTGNELDYEIPKNTKFVDALEFAFKKLSDNKRVTITDGYNIKSCLKKLKVAALQRGFDIKAIHEIRMHHVKVLLEQCGTNQDRWSAQSFNHYRTYLMRLFKELRQLDIIDQNPIKEIDKMPIGRKIREELTKKERGIIDEHLRINDPRFRNFVQIFFHSGARLAELARVKGRDVDLNNQRFKVTILKGKVSAEKWKPIKNIALEFWIEMLKGCGVEEYLFSGSLLSGKTAVFPGYYTKRWNKKVKKPLGISADLYSLKHSNIDEISKELGIKRASKAADHETPVITMIYAQGENARDDEDLKRMGNSFA